MLNVTGPVFIKRLVTGSLMASAAFVFSPAVASATSIKETIRLAVEGNPQIGVVSSDRKAVDQELRQARGGLLPSLDLRAAAGGEYTDSPTTRNTPDGDNSLLRNEAQLTLTQMLFDGFETASEIARQKSRVDSAAYRVEEAVEFVALDAVEAHLDVLRNQEIVKLNLANIDAHRRILSQVRDLADSGAGDIADVRQTEARLATAQENLAVSEGALRDAEAAYINVVGEQAVDLELGVTPIDALPVDREAAAAAASAHSPSVKIAAADVDVSSAEIRSSRAAFYPRVDLELNGTAADDVDGVKGSDYGASALVVMRYNLYRGGADIAREREFFHRSNESRAALRQVRRESEQDARVSYNALETARARTAALQSRVEAQRRTRDAYGSQFEIGQRDLLDLLDSENELLLARVSLTTAEFTEKFAVYRVLAVVGNLIDTIDLAKPRETISIHRTPADVQSPEAIDSKSIDAIDPQSEPRPIRGQEAGEPPIEILDAADEVNEASLIGADSNLALLSEENALASDVVNDGLSNASFVAADSVQSESLTVEDKIADAVGDWFGGLFAAPNAINGTSDVVVTSSELEDAGVGVQSISDMLDQINGVN